MPSPSIMRAVWRLWRRLGKADAVAVVTLCGRQAQRHGLRERDFAELVKRAARSVRHGAELAYLRRAVPAWSDDLFEGRYAASDPAMRAALTQYRTSTEAHHATFADGT